MTGNAPRPARARTRTGRHRILVIGGLIVLALMAGFAAAAVDVARLFDVPGALPPVDAPEPPERAALLPRPTPLPPPAPPSAGPRPGHPVMAGPGWRVASLNTISGTMMVIVETERFDAMTDIAREVVTPATPELLEALVYFERPRTFRAVGRVQWTPDGGYVPLRFGE